MFLWNYKEAVFFSKLRRKVLTPFKCLKFVKSFAATYSSHTLLINAKASRIRLYQKKTWKNRFEDRIDCGCGISCSELEKEWNLQGWSTKKPLVYWFSFLSSGFSKGVTHFYGSRLAMTGLLRYPARWNGLGLFPVPPQYYKCPAIKI